MSNRLANPTPPADARPHIRRNIADNAWSVGVYAEILNRACAVADDSLVEIAVGRLKDCLRRIAVDANSLRETGQ